MPNCKPLRDAEIQRRIEQALANLSYEQMSALRDLLARGRPPTQEEFERATGWKTRRSLREST